MLSGSFLFSCSSTSVVVCLTSYMSQVHEAEGADLIGRHYGPSARHDQTYVDIGEISAQSKEAFLTVEAVWQ